MAFKVILLNFPFSDALVSNKSASERSVRVAIPTLRLEHVVAKAIRQDKYLKATSFEWLMNQCTGSGPPTAGSRGRFNSRGGGLRAMDG